MNFPLTQAPVADVRRDRPAQRTVIELPAMTARPVTPIVMLPGMDGTGRLFDSFSDSLSSDYRPVPISFSTTRPESYDDLETFVRSAIAEIDQPFALLAESFSGPLAIRIAASPPSKLVALILVATFLRPPVSPRWRHLARPLTFRRSPPRMAVRHLLVGRHADARLVTSVVEAIRVVKPEVMACRAREILSVDVSEQFAAVELPILFIQGTRDRLVRADRSALDELNAGIKWAELDAPHLVLQAAPSEAAAATSTFLQAIT